MNEVSGDESFDSALEDDDAIEVEHLLSEPKSDHVSVDGVFCFDEENLDKCLNVEDNSSSIYERALKTNSGGMDSDTTQDGDDDLRFEVFDEILPEVDEVENLQAANGLSIACEDYLLDAECAEKVPGSDFTPCGYSSLENSSSESHSADFGGIDNDAIGFSEVSTVSVPVPKCKNGTLDKATICRLHGTFRSKCGCQAQGKNSMKFQISDSFDSNNHNENDMTFTRGLSLRGSSFPTTNVQFKSPRSQSVKRKRFAGRNVSAQNTVEASKVGNLVNQKRLRKPTKRYIEEVSDLRSKNFKGKQKTSTSPKDNLLRVKCRTEHHQMGVRRLKLASEKIHLNRASIQTPSEFRASEGCSKSHVSTSGHDSEEEPYSDESEDDYETTVRSRKGDDRRKHQRMWALSEVIKLVDGISQYGVGRWTEIKRLLFSTSDYRTPIDLRDKWRNLLRASNSWLQSEQEDEQKQKQASRPLPTAVLHRVSELASIYPYPKVPNSKKKQDGHVTSPLLLTYKGPRVGRRAVRR